MHNSRLLELLRTLSPAEQSALGRWLRSPFHNQREDVQRLFDFLSEKMEAPAKQLEKETVFARLFPGEGYDDKKLTYAMSFLYGAAQDFLVFNEWKQEGEAAYQLHLARSLRRRGLERHHETALQRAEAALESSPHRHIEHHYLSHLLHLERYESGSRERRTSSGRFQEWSDETTLYFIANKLRQICTALMHRAVSEKHFQLDLLDEVLVQVEAQGLQRHPAIGLYYYGYRALSEADSKPWFGLLREAMRQHIGRFPPAEMREVFTLAVNYCIRQINTLRERPEQATYLQEVFDLYREGLDNEVFVENGTLSRYTYNNIAIAGLGLKAFDWVEAFLSKYKPLLEPRYRESAWLFNLASLHFRKPDYGKTLELLTQADFDDTLHNLDARRMLLRSYFELGEFSALDSLLDSFSIFLRRRRDVGYLRQNYLNLIRFTKKLLQIPASDKAARERLRRDITETKALAEREWLLGKV